MIAWLTVPYWWHATLLEALWLLGGAVAVALTLTNLFDSWRDLPALKSIKTDKSVHARHYEMIRIAARGRITSQAARLTISCLILATGIFGVMQPNPLGGRTTWTGLTVTACLVAISLITAARSFFDYRERHTLYDLATGRSAVLAARLRSRNIPETEEQ